MAGDAAQATSAAPPPCEPGIYRAMRAGERLRQGEVLERVVEWVPYYKADARDDIDVIKPVSYGLALVVTQDCDLEQDWKQRSADPHVTTGLSSVLLCPLGKADDLRAAQSINSTLWGPIRNNDSPRFQYLAEVPSASDGAGEGHPPMLVDFRSVFTVRTIELYRQLRGGAGTLRRRFRLETPWVEHLQCRFAGYHARIGLPRDHFVPEARRPEPPAAR